MKKAILGIITLTLFISKFVFANNYTKGTIGVSLIIVPFAENNECFNKFCAFDTKTIEKN